MNTSMLDSFMKSLTRECMIREGESVLACCSGGIDSMVLLDLLVQAAGLMHLRVGVAHVDHGIRHEASSKDALFVAGHCAKLGLDCHVYRLGMDPGTPNLEEQARSLRYEAIFRCMSEHGYHAAATGHTMDDQAETLVYRFIRGSGVRGLAGMEHRGENRLIRPMLGFTRDQVTGYAVSRGIMHVEDLTNLDTTLVRNFIRKEIIPAMRKINPSVIRGISRLGEIAREEGGLIEKLSVALERDAQVLDWGMVKAYRLTDLEASPKPVLKRLIIRIVSSMLNEPRGIDAAQVEEIVGVVEGGKARHTVKRKVAVRLDAGSLVFTIAGPGPFYDLDVTAPGVYTITPLNQQVRISFDGRPASPLRLKSHMHGERLEGKRVVKLLSDRGVMRSLRPFWPVLVSGGEVLSIAGVLDSREGLNLRTEFPCLA